MSDLVYLSRPSHLKIHVRYLVLFIFIYIAYIHFEYNKLVPGPRGGREGAICSKELSVTLKCAMYIYVDEIVILFMLDILPFMFKSITLASVEREHKRF